jgi:hypothetical protein
MVRVLHTGDTHIGFRQYGLEERRKDFADAFLQVVQLAVDEKVSAVIHAGDLFEDRSPSTEDLLATMQGLMALKDAGISFLGVVGNHEQKRGVQWLDFFEELGLAVHLRAEQPFELEGVPIYGLDFSGRREIKLPRCQGGCWSAISCLIESNLTGSCALKSFCSVELAIFLWGTITSIGSGGSAKTIRRF